MWNQISTGVIGLHFKVADFIGLINFEWLSQNEIGNIDIVVFWRVCEKTLLNGLALGVWWIKYYLRVSPPISWIWRVIYVLSSLYMFQPFWYGYRGWRNDLNQGRDLEWKWKPIGSPFEIAWLSEGKDNWEIKLKQRMHLSSIAIFLFFWNL